MNNQQIDKHIETVNAAIARIVEVCESMDHNDSIEHRIDRRLSAGVFELGCAIEFLQLLRRGSNDGNNEG